MSEPLWTREAFLEASEGEARGKLAPEITGVSIDSRSLVEGDAFIAILGDNLDGHNYVKAALDAGASLAMVARDKLDSLPEDGRYVIVDDPLEALGKVAVAARARTHARVVAVTGSVGKTSSKEALRLALGASGKVHAPVASFNNHWGVPLTLARMPADTEYGIFEIGMNHPGEITPLVAMVRPHVAVITTIEPVHIEYFGSLEKIAQAKAEIFSGLEPGGVAILNRDNSQYDLLKFLATTAGVSELRSFGIDPDAQARLEDVDLHADGSDVKANVFGRELSYHLGMPGRHQAENSLAVLAAVAEMGADLDKACAALDHMSAPKGRGQASRLKVGDGTFLLLDESYNANPASMRAALAVLGQTPAKGGRRIAVLGDMLELGSDALRLHGELIDPVVEAGVDKLYLAGTSMAALWEKAPDEIRAAHEEKSVDLTDLLKADIRAGDVIMIKGSLGTRMGPIVEALKSEFPSADTAAPD